MNVPLEIDAVVLDCDGLLVETESGWTRAETAIFAENGFGFGPAEKQLLIGGTLEAGGAAMAEHFGKPGTGPELAERLADLVWEELGAGAPALPGARDLVCRLRDRGIPFAVASNSPRRFVDAALRSAGLAGLHGRGHRGRRRSRQARPGPVPAGLRGPCRRARAQRGLRGFADRHCVGPGGRAVRRRRAVRPG